MKYTPIKTMTTLALMAGFIITPAMAFANDEGEASVRTGANAKGDFCTLVANPAFGAMAKFDDRILKMDDKRDDRDAQISDRRGDRDEKIEGQMNNLQGKLDAEGRANLTPAQQAAFAEFQTSAQAALDLRGADFEKFSDDFRADADAIRNDHREGVDALIAKAKASLQAAVDKARADCTSGVASTTVQANFVASVKAIHKEFQDGRLTLKGETKTDIQTVKDEHQDERKDSRTAFRSSWQSAWTKFRAFFGFKARVQ